MGKSQKSYKYLGKRRPLIKGLGKIIGKEKYTGDFILPGMLHARIRRPALQ